MPVLLSGEFYFWEMATAASAVRLLISNFS